MTAPIFQGLHARGDDRNRTGIDGFAVDGTRLGGRYLRAFVPLAGRLTFTDPAHQTELERQRVRRRQRHEVDVEIRPLARYDAVIPA